MNLKKTVLLSAAVCCFMMLASCKDSGVTLPVRELVIECAGGQTVTVAAEIADTEETRNRGFMERESIPDGTGMLFVFQKDKMLSFWMKNTPTPLSIAFIDSRGKIRNIYDMKPFSLATITSTVACRYALEVPQGWFARAGVSVGDVIPCLPEQF